MPKLIDITGKRFGNWIAISRAANYGRTTRWLCRCDCGTVKTVDQYLLRIGRSSSCGCKLRKDITGNRYGRLTAIEVVQYARRNPGGPPIPTLWKFQCDCGNELIARYGDVVNSGRTLSCGCLSRELTIAHNKNMSGDNHPKPLLGKSGKDHPCWKGGNLAESCRARNEIASELNEWRLKVFERDNYTCQVCGSYGGKLNAHHILHFKTHPEQRLNVDNGMTVCTICHKSLHSTRRVG